MHLRSLSVLSIAAAIALSALAAPAARAEDDETAKKYEQMIDKAVGFLATKGQAADGSYSAPAGPAVTALVTASLLRHGRSPDDPQIAKALKYVEGFIHEDGGIYGEGNHKNYETCISVICFKQANRGGKYDALIKKADAFIKATQWGGDGQTTPDAVVSDWLFNVIEKNSCPVFELDLAELGFLDSSGISVLVVAARLINRKGARLRAINPQPAVRRVIDTTGVDTLLGLS
jgi:anti-anti-sigma factor